MVRELSILAIAVCVLGQLDNSGHGQFCAKSKDGAADVAQQIANDLPGRLLAAAMLGDSVAEQQIIDQFQRTDSAEKRNELAMALARIGSVKSLTVLAHALRSPCVAQWGGTGKQSFRLVVIASLSWAYPDVELLWEPRTAPNSDRYYEQIEHWAEKPDVNMSRLAA